MYLYAKIKGLPLIFLRYPNRYQYLIVVELLDIEKTPLNQ